MSFDQRIKEIKKMVQYSKPGAPTPSLLKKMTSLIDLTSLNDNDTENSITLLCQKAVNRYGHVAALCVYPKFVSLVKQTLPKKTNIHIATVANFPEGKDSLKQTLASIQQSITSGANEIDVVYPYHDFLAGNRKTAKEYLEACREACGNTIVLKVILETGALDDLRLMAEMIEDVLLTGVDFIKTSTGKIARGATLEAAANILLSLRERQKQSLPIPGLKVSGGVRTIAVAQEYITLAEKIMGSEWVNAKHFRLGASQLVDEILKEAIA